MATRAVGAERINVAGASGRQCLQPEPLIVVTRTAWRSLNFLFRWRDRPAIAAAGSGVKVSPISIRRSGSTRAMPNFSRSMAFHAGRRRYHRPQGCSFSGGRRSAARLGLSRAASSSGRRPGRARDKDLSGDPERRPETMIVRLKEIVAMASSAFGWAWPRKWPATRRSRGRFWIADGRVALR